MKNVLLLFSSTRNLKLLVVRDLPKAIIGRAVFSDGPSLGGTKAYVIFTKADLSLYLFIGSFETVNCGFLILTFQFNRNRDKGTQLLQRSGLCKLQIQGVADFCKFNWLLHVDTHVGRLGKSKGLWGECESILFIMERIWTLTGITKL